MNKQTEEQSELDTLLLEARTDEYGDSGNYNEAKLKALILARDAKQKEKWEKELTVITHARPHGRTLKQFQQFMQAIEQGKTIEWHGVDYVVLSRNHYDNLQKKLAHLSSKGEKE